MKFLSLKFTYLSIFCFLLFQNVFANNSRGPGRSPAVEPVFSIAIDETEVQRPSPSHYYNFNLKNSKPIRNYDKRGDYLSGRLPAGHQNETGSSASYLLLTALLLLPLLIRYSTFAVYLDRKTISQKEFDRRQPENSNIIPIQERRNQALETETNVNEVSERKKVS